MPNPNHLAARFLLTLLKRDDRAFADAVNPNQPRANGRGVDGARMLHEWFTEFVQTPDFYIEADIDSGLERAKHKNHRKIA
jgi:hypothetical protein